MSGRLATCNYWSIRRDICVTPVLLQQDNISPPDSSRGRMNLTFEDVELDIERWLETYGRKDILSSGQVCIRGYDIAKSSVLDLYFENRKCKPLVTFALKGYKDDAFIDKLTQLLLEQRNFLQLRRLWTFLTGEKKANYWQVLAVKQFFPCVDDSGKAFSAAEVRETHVIQRIPNCRQETLALLRRYEEILCSLDEQDGTLFLLREEMEKIACGHIRKAAGKAIKDTIDDARFWQLIDEARVAEFDTISSTNHLISLLERYSGTQIKMFHKLLVQKLEQLNHWDVWALAFLAQDGCSDDAFESFRCWIIMQGESVFEKVVADVDAVLPDIPSGVSTSCNTLIQAVCIAFESREGVPLSGITKDSKVKGVPWNEETVAKKFPKIASWYGRSQSAG